MLCGYISEDERGPSIFEGSPFDIDGTPYSPPICPGWTIRQPLVREVVEAWNALDRGVFEVVCPDPANVIVEGVFLLDSAIQGKRKRDQKNG